MIKNFKKNIAPLLLFCITLFPYFTFATVPGDTVGLNPMGSTKTLMELVTKVLDVLIKIGIPLAGLAIAWAGWMFVSANGKEGDVKKAKDALQWTMVGIGVLLGASAIVNVIDNTIKGLK
ncbi:MAG: hypothetical protein WCO84_02230 [bacterium]